MSAPLIHGGTGRTPLLGHNLVRLLYLDEAGTDRGAPAVCVAGVLVHGDKQWPEIDRRILSLIEKYIPPEDRLNFFFHATDIYHGSGYFSRKKPEWADEKKRQILLCELIAIIDNLSLPIVYGHYKKDGFGVGTIPVGATHQSKSIFIHNAAAVDCLSRADKWLEHYAPDELAMVVHEDGTPAKALIKKTTRIMRNIENIRASGLSEAMIVEMNLPLKRIIDTVHFVEKSDGRPLQLADVCAFAFNRISKNKDVPGYITSVMLKHMDWFKEFASYRKETKVGEGGS